MMVLASDVQVAQNIGFAIIAAVMVLGALNAVSYTHLTLPTN